MSEFVIEESKVPTLSGKTVAVTGATGFIGSHLTEALVAHGAHVKCLNHYNSAGRVGWLETLPQATRESLEIVHGNIRDYDSVQKLVENTDCVFHLAALIGIPYSYYSPQAYLETNIRGTLNVLQAIRQRETLLIHTSTSEVYGSAQSVPICEQHRIHPQSPYAASKSAADALVHSFFCSFNSPVVTIRPFNTFGPRQSMRAVIPNIICQLLNSPEDSVTLRLGALDPTRDFSFVERTVSGFIRAANQEAALGHTINVGSGFEISIKDTASTIARLMHKEINFEEDSQRMRPKNSEVTRLYANIQKSEDLLGMNNLDPLKELEKGLNQTIAWFRKSENLEYYRSLGYQR
jgi:NAD dependent epimerase/dehydratase